MTYYYSTLLIDADTFRLSFQPRCAYTYHRQGDMNEDG